LLSSHLRTSEDISDLIPTKPEELSKEFTYIKNAPFMHLIAIAVGGEDNHAAYAAMLGESLKCPLIPEVSTGISSFLTSNFLEKLIPLTSNLLTVNQLAKLPDTFSIPYIQNAMARNKQEMLGPAGIFTQKITALDPLRLRDFFLKNIFTTSSLGKFNIEDGFFVGEHGKYSLVLVRPAIPMTDSHGSIEIMTKIQDAILNLPKSLEIYVQGSYAHTQNNTSIIMSDLYRILPISFIVLIFLLILFFRNLYLIFALCVPVISLIFSAGILSIAYNTISGIVITFSSVILGITIDYAIHSYFALASSSNFEDNLYRLSKSLKACAITTSSAFIFLYISDIPAIKQMSLFGAAGIFAALVISIFILPHFIANKENTFILFHKPYTQKITSCPLIAIFTSISLLIILTCITTLRIDGDIRNLSWKSDRLMADEKKIRDIWGFNSEQTFIIAPGNGDEPGIEKALHINDNVWNILKNAHIAASSVAPLLPSQQTQIERKDIWHDFWRKNGQNILKEVRHSQLETGFSLNAFDPFISLLSSNPPNILPGTLREMGMGFFLDMFATQTQEASLVYTMLPSNEKISDEIHSKLFETGASLVSGELFRQKMANAFGKEIRYFCIGTFFVTLCVVIILFRSPLRFLPALLPMFNALAATLIFFLLFDIPVNIFHAASLPLVIALSVDYGIFMQSSFENNAVSCTENAILLSGLTSLTGFGCLMLARHPALYSIGITVTIGITTAMLTALWLLPNLLRKQNL
jgi:predicted exporter